MQDVYSKTHPFFASIKERKMLTAPGAGKTVMHLVIDLKGSHITYEVGDSLAVFPENEKEDVSCVLNYLSLNGDEKIKNPRGEDFFSIHDFLLKKANLITPTRKLVRACLGEEKSKEILEGDFKTFQHHYTVPEFLEEYRNEHLNKDTFATLFMPLLPRFYSIASSQKTYPEEVHLTVAALEYHIEDRLRKGICTHYLCYLAPLEKPVLPVYLQRHHGFTLPKEKTAPLIMIGPGTGLAPFRAFLQEREAQNAPGKNWLFFGERHRHSSFFYEEEVKRWQQNGLITRLSLAFSRDQAKKVYVQDRMLEEGKELFSWLEKGAFLFVCGDADRMAKDVDASLHKIIEEHGGLDSEAAKAYIKNLKIQKRYLRDVY